MSEQQLREALEQPMVFGSDAYDRMVAAVGRLLEPIPPHIVFDNYLSPTEAELLRKYRAWLIGGEE